MKVEHNCIRYILDNDFTSLCIYYIILFTIILFLFFKIYSYWFQRRGKDRSINDENHCLAPSCTPHNGDRAHNQACPLDQNWTQDPSVCSQCYIHWTKPSRSTIRVLLYLCIIKACVKQYAITPIAASYISGLLCFFIALLSLILDLVLYCSVQQHTVHACSLGAIGYTI